MTFQRQKHQKSRDLVVPRTPVLSVPENITGEKTYNVKREKNPTPNGQAWGRIGFGSWIPEDELDLAKTPKSLIFIVNFNMLVLSRLEEFDAHS